MRHLVNFTLLLFFVTLVISGILRFFKPFEIATTRVHIVFGFGVAVLVVCHLLDFTGHGGSSSEMDGRLFYNTKHLTTAKDIIERILVKVVTE